MNELKTKIEEIVSSGKCMELMMLKNTLKTSELKYYKILMKRRP